MNTRFIHSSNLYDTCMHDSNLGQIMEVRYNSMLLIKDVLFVVKQDMQSLSVVQYVFPFAAMLKVQRMCFLL